MSEHPFWIAPAVLALFVGMTAGLRGWRRKLAAFCWFFAIIVIAAAILDYLTATRWEPWYPSDIAFFGSVVIGGSLLGAWLWREARHADHERVVSGVSGLR